MRYAIVINLDYISHSEDACQILWSEIRERMIATGFRCENRIFTIEAAEETAYKLARDVIESIEEHKEYQDKRIHRYLKDFYGYDMACTTNLLVAPADDILVKGE
ncbi:MAG: hypothetical protein BMS9Abin26_0729 [Gammaproteobacteria bacterium]|nr:MAG: hypothetical protein BMS9Abin26_0729 [Gammaproteobacteria bacterium]